MHTAMYLQLVLSTAGIKKGKRSSADGAVDDWFSRNKTKRKTFWTKLSHSLNPLTWFSSQKDKGDSGALITHDKHDTCTSCAVSLCLSAQTNVFLSSTRTYSHVPLFVDLCRAKAAGP